MAWKDKRGTRQRRTAVHGSWHVALEGGMLVPYQERTLLPERWRVRWCQCDAYLRTHAQRHVVAYAPRFRLVVLTCTSAFGRVGVGPSTDLLLPLHV